MTTDSKSIKRFVMYLSDAFGGHGGIAKFNRDFIRAACSQSSCGEMVVYPRVASRAVSEMLPRNLRLVVDGLNSKWKYTLTILRGLCSCKKYDIVICGHINLLPIAWLVSVWIQSPLLLIIHGIEAWTPHQQMVIRYLVKHIDVCICVSEVSKTRFLSWAGVESGKCYILPNCVDMKRFRPSPKNEQLLSRHNLKGRPVLMTLGRLDSAERFKGFDEVLEVLPSLIEHLPNVVYLIVGGGPDRGRLERKVVSLGLSSHVVFAGLIEESEKVDYYNLADVFVMPSRGEGFGIVLLEAMSCGVPTVASCLDGGREALRDGALGVLVDPRDLEDVQKGILQALRLPKRRPTELDYFSSSAYECRVHKILDRLSKVNFEP